MTWEQVREHTVEYKVEKILVITLLNATLSRLKFILRTRKDC